jgi:plastocyanin
MGAGMARAPFNLNRLLIVYAGLFTLGALALMASTGAAPAAQLVPFLPGALVALVLLFYHPRWMYLVAGILVAAFPLVVIFVFGAYEGIVHPGSGVEGYALILLLVAAVLGLIGGIAGFVQSRRGTAPPAGALLRAPQGVAASLAVAVALGLLLSSMWATADYKMLAEAPADFVLPESTVTLVAKDVKFDPRDVPIPAGKLVALRVDNQDAIVHTLAYNLDGKVREAILPAKTTTEILFRFDQPQTIHFWCSPHSGGEGDTSPGSMWGTLNVTAS